MKSQYWLPVLGLAAVSVSSPTESTRDTCIPCAPAGWKSRSAPSVGPDLASMYPNLVNSVQNIRWKRGKAPSSSEAPICCAAQTQCALMNGFNIPFCYDKFTTNFLLPDRSYGNIAAGTYNTSSVSVDLLTGNVSDGSTNIYAVHPEAKPNTATLVPPPVFTASGVGSAIPIASLGIAAANTVQVTVVSTRAAITLGATTMPATVISGISVPASTVSATTIPATTVTSIGAPTGTAAGIVTSNHGRRMSGTWSRASLILGGWLIGFMIGL